jgi:hypothetical protein
VKIAPDDRGDLVQSESAYTELATGLNWWNPKTETWNETVEAFEILPQGYAVARRGPHKVISRATSTRAARSMSSCPTASGC